MVNLRNFDLNLLVIFRAIMARGSIAGAAEEIGLSPSAVSHALARLRVMLNDELFFRTADGVCPTDRARELSADIERGLGFISTAISLQHQFVPSEAKRVFTMQVADYVSGFLLPRLAERLQVEAPGVSFDILPFSISPESVWDRVDMQVRLTPGRLQPEMVRSQRLLADEIVVLMRRDHPRANDPMTAELYAELPHVKLSQSATGTTVIDDALAARGLERHMAMTVASWFEIPDIVAKSDLIAIAPRRLFSLDPRLRNLKASPLPLEEVVFSFDLCWDLRTEREPGQKWLRKVVSDVFKEIRT
ncbi:DNA-binding transcriptional regulator, LysR family [Roseovarius tolerans]|uniref:DNA-binding transcriptional regulator, LysR family n=1 Tax=Roseovarius tolerans TaxID=74031 RepID=A0A1H7Y7M3_9RHOB|nr:LysR family transcriptional regulator [Roseovarius tolerans]SEM41189.1 DNA-binding transcriptional regulator, LysR family [Roseovarius tolerans]|tara:strand:+ start:506 stop:1417 length:912 start_codon:yes stop_codon:yes gene_type:complete